MALAPVIAEGQLPNIIGVLYTAPSGGITNIKCIRITSILTLDIVTLKINRRGVLRTILYSQVIPLGWTLSYPMEKGDEDLILEAQDTIEGFCNNVLSVDYVISGITIKASS